MFVLGWIQVFIDRLLSGNFYPTEGDVSGLDGPANSSWFRGLTGFLNNLGYTTYHAFSLLLGGEEYGNLPFFLFPPSFWGLEVL